jgi:hypothetical protein
MEESRNPEAQAELVAGLTDPRTISLQRFTIRMREDAVTRSGWRLAFSCAEGDAAIVRVEPDGERVFFRGEGVVLGWPRERLEAAYDALRPREEEPDFVLNQLG